MRHDHRERCWRHGTYVPCGEHHRHDYNCGHGNLAPDCPTYEGRLRHMSIPLTLSEAQFQILMTALAQSYFEPIGEEDNETLLQLQETLKRARRRALEKL
jgi:hypothetical protein